MPSIRLRDTKANVPPWPDNNVGALLPKWQFLNLLFIIIFFFPFLN